MQAGAGVGSAGWVRDRLRDLPPGDGWVDTDACRELINWLYAVARQRAASAGVESHDRAEVAQDAMPAIVSALQRTRFGFADARNPAAALERVTLRAVSCSVHRIRMRGLGGVPANGRNWGTPYPRSVGGDAALRLMADVHSSGGGSSHEIEAAAAAVASWVAERVEVTLIEDAVHAIIYILERLVSGRARAALVRGNRVGLASDPAMFHLGFDPAGARAFAAWLLGRRDPAHERPAVLDAALLGENTQPKVLLQWRRTALDFAFATTDGRGMNLPTDRRIA